MTAIEEETFRFTNLNGTEVILLFKAFTGKRKGQLNKLCEKHLGNLVNYSTSARTRYDFVEMLKNFKTNSQYFEDYQIVPSSFYLGSDLQVFRNIKIGILGRMIYTASCMTRITKLSSPHPRSIIFLVDRKGNCGKSSFFKYLFFKDNENIIGRISYG